MIHRRRKSASRKSHQFVSMSGGALRRREELSACDKPAGEDEHDRPQGWAGLGGHASPWGSTFPVRCRRNVTIQQIIAQAEPTVHPARTSVGQ